ncbi:hypothetical protein CHARACLAT_005680 [Characodon lateralis]|uniref:Uncharacterized protein n=1 Tax=Characodon lateralis TaxID=208331 RepID=A0ABU7EBI8_9TELE|nr:hypothetical protein [Characodon lateralis]
MDTDDAMMEKSDRKTKGEESAGGSNAQPKKKKSHVKKMRAARRRYRGSQRRGTLYNLFDSKITYQIKTSNSIKGGV